MTGTQDSKESNTMIFLHIHLTIVSFLGSRPRIFSRVTKQVLDISRHLRHPEWRDSTALGGSPDLFIGSLLMLESFFPFPVCLFRSVGFTCGLVVRYLCVSLFTRGYEMSTRIPGAALAGRTEVLRGSRVQVFAEGYRDLFSIGINLRVW